MHQRSRCNALKICYTQFNSFSSKSMKVAILGAASKTGSCLSLFLKQSPLIDELAIYDNKCTYGLALDLNYIDTRCKVSTCSSSEACLKRTLDGAKIVMIIADRLTKKELNPDDVLRCNADTLSDLLPNIIKYCPQAMVAVAMHPINSLIPLALEMYKKAGVHDYNRLFGVISLECLRANTFAAEVIGIEPECITIPVIGGSCSETCIPIFSRAKPCNKISQQEASRLTKAVRFADDEISEISKKKERTCFAMAFGAARFCMSLCKALRHQHDVVECAYVRSYVIPDVTYFAAPLALGPDGIQKHLGIPPLNDYERKLLNATVPTLQSAIALGEALALGHEHFSSERNQLNSPHTS
ncbi:PREDICTED: probable malate dehydrogenase, mitochondrial [Dufourea novaeangliae]|uniref:probable malate dehydrogenase, mitochondrial n=1 Tax=Dufourea novaeangliae TaxID=178035 RepID=UPI0007670FF2|nr:PREDICTED: probable malate dehydrogenase, mitochondrial [Dufourea novaeangliae]